MMASSKVMPTTSSANPDLPRQHSLCPSLSTLISDLQTHNNHALSSDPSSLNMDDLLKNIYSSPDPHAPAFPGASFPRPDPDSPSAAAVPASAKSVDEVWKEIVSGGRDPRRPAAEGMTLEDFLTKAGAVREEDVRGVAVPVGGAYGSEANPSHNQSNNTAAVNNPTNANSAQLLGGGNGMVMVDAAVPAPGGGRGRLKRRAVEDAPVDKATQQKQRRMIKNRESAARSRERKQAYTVELESLVTQLEEEHARLLREEAELNKERFKQLMENLVPVVDKQRPPRGGLLRRVRSVQW